MSHVYHWVADPYDFEFMRRALLGVLLVGAVSPLVGCWIVLRRLAYLGDAMGHATLSGVALAYLAGISITIGALGAGLAMAGIIALLTTHPRLRPDAVIGIAEVTLFALGVLIISRSHDIAVNLDHLLFGSVTTISSDDLRINAILGAVTILAIAVAFNDLRALTFDPLHARLAGIRVRALQQGLLIGVTLAVVISLQTVGLLMSVAMLVVPASAARLLTTTMARMSGAAVAIGMASSATGLTLSYHLRSAPGATIALTAVGCLVVAFVITRQRRGISPAAHAAERPATEPALP